MMILKFESCYHRLLFSPLFQLRVFTWLRSSPGKQWVDFCNSRISCKHWFFYLKKLINMGQYIAYHHLYSCQSCDPEVRFSSSAIICGYFSQQEHAREVQILGLVKNNVLHLKVMSIICKYHLGIACNRKWKSIWKLSTPLVSWDFLFIRIKRNNSV